jgi:hypothetical protein
VSAPSVGCQAQDDVAPRPRAQQSIKSLPCGLHLDTSFVHVRRTHVTFLIVLGACRVVFSSRYGCLLALPIPSEMRGMSTWVV